MIALALLLLQAADRVDLPEIPAYAVREDLHYVLGSAWGKPAADRLRELRQVPRIRSGELGGAPLIQRHLGRDARAVRTQGAALESDWLTLDELEVAASLVEKVQAFVQSIGGRPDPRPVRILILRTREDLVALTEKMTADDRIRRQVKSFAGAFVDGVRLHFDDDPLDVASLAVSDAATFALPPAMAAHHALREGLLAYLSVLLTGRFTSAVAPDTTTPSQRESARADDLLTAAREALLRPKRDPLSLTFKVETNALTFERLALMVAVWDFLLREKRDALTGFFRILGSESLDEGGKLKGPDGRHLVLAKAAYEALGMDLEALETSLREFAREGYAYPEGKVAEAAGLGKEWGAAKLKAFQRISEERRDGKKLPAKDAKTYVELRAELEKRLQKSRIE